MHSSNRWNTSIDQRGGASHDQKGGFAPGDDAPAQSIADNLLPSFGPGLGSKRRDTPTPESAAAVGTPVQEEGDRASAPAAHRGPVDFLPLVSAIAPPHLLMLVGPPGAGKSTLAARFLPLGWCVLSPDAVRKQLTESEEYDPAMSPLVWSIVDRRMQQRLRRGQSVVLDAANSRADHRAKKIKIAREASASVSAIVLATPPRLALQRNRCRSRQVGYRLIISYWKDLVREWPTPDEGFDIVLQVDPCSYRILDMQISDPNALVQP